MVKRIYFIFFVCIFVLSGCKVNDTKEFDSPKESESKNQKTATISNDKNRYSDQKVKLEIKRSSDKDGIGVKTAVRSSSSEVNIVKNEKQACQRVHKVIEGKLQLKFSNMIGKDYLFEALSLEIKDQGGTGFGGFYRVSPQGQVTETDATGKKLY